MNRIAIVASTVVAIALSGCGGQDGGGGGGSPSSAASTQATAGALNIAITGVIINSAPVVRFRATEASGAGVTGLSAADLRFNIAKLLPGANGDSSRWQNYINRASNGAVQGSEERLAAGYAFGRLVNHGDGSYTYTFATDITNAAANPCPAPCTDADGAALDIGYAPSLTHRVTIQQANSAYPKASGILDFVPGPGAFTRDTVLSATCNQCHTELTAHGTRADTKLCVTCHNPGSWVAGTPNTTVDFKVMIHKIHYNIYGSVNTTDPAAPNYLPRELPSVDPRTPPSSLYAIGSRDFSKPTFTQDVRNCTRCHDGALSAQGDNWKTQASIAACGSCHDNVYFGTRPDPARPYQTLAHRGGVYTDNSTCALCHAPGRVADVVVAHEFPARLAAAAAKFKFNILSVSPTSAGGVPVVTFSVTDPTNGDAPYDIKTHPAFTAGGASTLSVKLAWTTSGRPDIGNDGSSQNYGQPVSVNALTAAVAGATPGTYAATSPIAIPAGQTGTLRVIMDGHPAGDVTQAGSYADRLAVKSVFRDFAITGTQVVARRTVVDVAKCNACHAVLSLHGANRNDEPGVCVACHNPNATDAARRPAGGGIDGKAEESIDLKRMIHAIHAGQASNGGFREKGIVVYGFGNTANDFSGVMFPGELKNCTVCHTGTSYQLQGIWASPAASGILGSTVAHQALTNDASDDLRISPTAAVCSSCHDSALAKTHMEDLFGGGKFSATQATLQASVEQCAFCHGAGKTFDVKTVHDVK